MIMKLTITTLLLFSFSLFLSAQEGNLAHTIKGKVINANSNQPVSYTNIGLKGTFYGTASDAEGNFELKVPKELVDNEIYFSAVGFKNRQFPVKSLFEKEFNVIKLRSQSYGVDEVDVAAQNMVLIRILRMASENIKYNYGAGPFNLHCDYNNEKTINGQAQTPHLAKVLLFDETGYSNVSKKDAFLSRNYSITSKSSKDNYTFSSSMMNIDDVLELDWVRSASGVLNPALLNDYKLKLASQPTIKGKEYWKIAFTQKNPTLAGSGNFYASSIEGEITINKEDYSVLAIDFNIQSPKQNRQGRGLAIGASNKNILTDINYTCAIHYQDLLVKEIVLGKKYDYQGDKIAEQSTLKVTRAHTNNLTKVKGRDYFAAE